ncbi:MAG: MFS transporter [Rhodospirillales bacterium]|nr:MAG: MFS transporter [Rhodospirillales bacterium]
MTRARPLAIVVFSAACVLLIGMGLRQAFGLFLPRMTVDLGMSREMFGFGVALQNILWGIGALPAGVLADLYGSARVAATCALLYVGGLVLMALADGPALYIGGSILLGIGLGGVSFSVVMSAVGKAAPPESRVTMLAWVGFGGAIGQFLAIPLTHALIAGLDWRLAMAVCAALSAIMLPLTAGIAGVRGDNADGAQPSQTLREALREAFSTPSYVLLTIGFFVCGFQLASITTHLPAYLVDLRLPASLGAVALMIIGLANIAGNFAAGWLAGRFEKRAILAALYAIRGVSMVAFLLMPPSAFSVSVFALGMGVTWLATVPLTGGLVATFFGPAFMSTLYGIVFFSHQLGGFFGAWLAGALYDRTGSYSLVWWSSAALAFIAAAMHWAIVERPAARPAHA